MSADLEKLRIDDDDFARSARDDSPAAEGSVSFLGTTTTVSSYPTAAGKFFAITPKQLLGTETEGGSGSSSALGSGVIYAKHIGTSVPASGTDVIVTFVPYRFTFEY